MAIPKTMQPKYDEIAPLINAFCDDKLNEDFKRLCIHLLEKLCRKRPSPLLGGRVGTWAAGIVYAIGANNFIFDHSQPYHLAADEISAYFGLAASTVGNKAAELRRMFDIDYMNAEWMIPKHIDQNVGLWMIQVNGFIIDARQAVPEIQRMAFEKGLIPYVPADREPASATNETEST